MKRSLLISLIVVAGGSGLLLLAASATPPKPDLPPYVELMTKAMNSPAADKAYFQSKIDEYYRAPVSERAMKDGVAAKSEPPLTRQQSYEKAVNTLDEFCEQNPRRCQ